MEMIQKLLLRRIELIRKIVKNRIKLPSHQSYLKAIISLLPEESKREFIPYII
jgi:transposase